MMAPRSLISDELCSHSKSRCYIIVETKKRCTLLLINTKIVTNSTTGPTGLKPVSLAQTLGHRGDRSTEIRIGR